MGIQSVPRPGEFLENHKKNWKNDFSQDNSGWITRPLKSKKRIILRAARMARVENKRQGREPMCRNRLRESAKGEREPKGEDGNT